MPTSACHKLEHDVLYVTISKQYKMYCELTNKELPSIVKGVTNIRAMPEYFMYECQGYIRIEEVKKHPYLHELTELDHEHWSLLLFNGTELFTLGGLKQANISLDVMMYYDL